MVLSVAGVEQEWREAALAAARRFAQHRLAGVARALGERAWLEHRFTIGDLIMIDVLRTVSEDELVAAHPNLSAYVERGMARPAFKAAMAAQMAAFAQNEPVTA